MLATKVIVANQAEHNAKMVKIQAEITKAQEDVNIENARMETVGVQKEGYTFCTPITVHGQSEPRAPPH